MRPFGGPLGQAVLVRRYKRFLADVRWPDGRVETVHCPNPGAMTGCDTPGRPAAVSDSGNPRRKLRKTLEMIRVNRTWVCVNTAVANRVVGHWLDTSRVLPGCGPAKREVSHLGSRFDFRLGSSTYLEVKSVTFARGRVAAFPDARTERGRRHVETLARHVGQGGRGILFFFVARGDACAVRPADEIDPGYGRALREAHARGVEIVVRRAQFSPRGVRLGPELPLLL